MADGQVLLDFSDLGGRRIWPPAEKPDFSDIAGPHVGEAKPAEGHFTKFADLGPVSVQHHPEWLRQWPASTTSERPQQPDNPSQQKKPLDFSDLGGKRISPPLEPLSQQINVLDPGRRVSQSALPQLQTRPQIQPRKSTWQQIADLNDAIDAAEMHTVAGAGKDLGETAKGLGSLVKPPDFMLHPIQQRPRTLGEAISQGAQAGAYATGLASVGHAVKGYYDAVRQNIQRAEEAADKGDTTGVLINSSAAGLPVVGPLIGGLYEEAQTNPDPFAVAGKGISRVAQVASMAPERSFIPNPVRAITKGAGKVLPKIGDGSPHVSPIRIPETIRSISSETLQREQTPIARGTVTSRPRPQFTPEQEAVRSSPEWVRNPETGKMELVSEATSHAEPKTPEEPPTGEKSRPLQSGNSKTIKVATAKALNERFGKSLHGREWGRALENLKGYFNLPSDFHGQIMDNGDFTDAEGKVIGNIHDHL